MLLYEKPELGRHFWVKDNALEKPQDVTRRCLTKDAWILGAPYRDESWPGMRSPDALTRDELAQLEAWVTGQLGIAGLLPPDRSLSHNHAQLVGGGDSPDGAKPCFWRRPSDSIFRAGGFIWMGTCRQSKRVCG